MSAAPFPAELPPHPRLFLTPERVRALRAQIAPGGDPISARLFARIAATADGILPQRTSTRAMEGRRLLTVSRRVLSRVLHLGLFAVLTDSARHARRAIDEMLAAADFSDWNPSHFLDTAEMTMALAAGYDWLQERMTPDERERITARRSPRGNGGGRPPRAAAPPARGVVRTGTCLNRHAPRATFRLARGFHPW